MRSTRHSTLAEQPKCAENPENIDAETILGNSQNIQSAFGEPLKGIDEAGEGRVKVEI